jgi:mono/diheme cytochrome c family protein
LDSKIELLKKPLGKGNNNSQQNKIEKEDFTMKKWYWIFGLVMVVFILAAVSCGPAATPAPTATPTQDIAKGKALVESRCSTCHGLAQVQAKRLDPVGWQALVQRMVNNGAQLTPDQQQLVVEYLSQTYPSQ